LELEEARVGCKEVVRDVLPVRGPPG
jgi:hypothetical protein